MKLVRLQSKRGVYDVRTLVNSSMGRLTIASCQTRSVALQMSSKTVGAFNCARSCVSKDTNEPLEGGLLCSF